MFEIWSSGGRSRGSFRRGGSFVVILQPAADDLFKTGAARGEPARGVERFLVVGEKIDVLPGEGFAEHAHHPTADAAPPVHRMGPHVDDVGITNAVRQRARGPDHLRSVERIDAAKTGPKRTLHLQRGASVVEAVRGKRCLEGGPVDPIMAGGVDDGHQNGRACPGSDSLNTRRNSPWMRASASASSASNRNTMTGVVFEARARPKPSVYSTRSPSMRMISEAPGKLARSARRAIIAWAEAPPVATLSSGVERLSGRECNTADASASFDRISRRRAPAYKPSSKPYHRSAKKVWPLISPASSAPVSFILALISECPVFHSSGRPRWRSIHGFRLRVDFTS